MNSFTDLNSKIQIQKTSSLSTYIIKNTLHKRFSSNKKAGKSEILEYVHKIVTYSYKINS